MSSTRRNVLVLVSWIVSIFLDMSSTRIVWFQLCLPCWLTNGSGSGQHLFALVHHPLPPNSMLTKTEWICFQRLLYVIQIQLYAGGRGDGLGGMHSVYRPNAEDSISSTSSGCVMIGSADTFSIALKRLLKKRKWVTIFASQPRSCARPCLSMNHL